MEKLDHPAREQVFKCVCDAIFGYEMHSGPYRQIADYAKREAAKYFKLHLPELFEHHYKAYEYSFQNHLSSLMNKRAAEVERYIKTCDLPPIYPFWNKPMNNENELKQHGERFQEYATDAAVDNWTHPAPKPLPPPVLIEESRGSVSNLGSSLSSREKDKNPVTVFHADQVQRLTDLEIGTLRNFMSYCRMMLLHNPSFDYRGYVEPKFMTPFNQLVAACEYSYKMNPKLLATWGKSSCDVVFFMEELIRLKTNSGKTYHESLYLAKMQERLYPTLRAYHPGKVETWPDVFGVLDDIIASYGTSVYQHAVKPMLDLHASVSTFWKDLIAPANTSVALKRLVSVVQEQINQDYQQTRQPRPGFTNPDLNG